MSKSFICLALIVFIGFGVLGSLALASWLINTGGTIGGILSPFAAIAVWFGTYKVCGLVCKHFIQGKK
jgi:hypothetical protein